MELSDVAKNSFELLKKLRRDLHQLPEKSGEEFKTQSYICDFLSFRGIEYRKIATGVMADFKGKDESKTVALRADTDALNIKEETGLSYASKNGNMHACGHDGHTAMLLTVCGILASNPPPVNVRAIFQFGEEGCGGAETMISGGALNGVGEIYALHLDPSLPLGSFASKEGAMMAGAEEFTVSFKGLSAHCAEPEKGINALLPLGELINNQTELKKGLDGIIFHIGKVSGGDARNIIAENACAESTLRYYDANTKDVFFEKLRIFLNGLDKKYGTKHNLEFFASYPPVVNKKAGFKRVKGILPDILDAKKRFAAEDFAFYLKETEGCFVWLGTKDENFYYPLHSNKFGFSEEALVYGVEFYLKLLNSFS